MSRPVETTDSASPFDWLRLLPGLAIVYVLFHWLAKALGSDRGQAGVVVGAVVVAATVFWEVLLFRKSLVASVKSLGLTSPKSEGLVASALLSVLILAAIPIYSIVTGISFALLPGWYVLLPGLFAQAGIAEETLFRGYLFRHLRSGRSFWRAAWLSMVPFVCVHLILFLDMPIPIATAAVGLACIISFPFAYLFEQSGNTVWGPALLHFVVQGAVKLVVTQEQAGLTFPLVWMAASAVLPWLAFLAPRRQREWFLNG